ncbi:hypothetical protein CH063_14278 [Colletotrichum higginsianum]|uniref:Uncharacterized protein n=2 Tax=Colletotrichum higginsianum TaxID=80884 RepID=H1VXW7_COLHI|nr:uncharacterized protein CH63R_09914 [Colletotrichum higginsianum IMI 349063]OBR05794.1 hypothetical protein CH63R_09914 [Colletotrichum higginsianum IMI 349063]TIC90749.1 hypothetical protein CH35J_011740 [Colletotrichum higginsianum]GJD03925.1 hypothetical protein ColKHC_12750 [Colletotrichum higginsianum]CCF45079.1 hypothetical protein CH063_14278 [Colletotrichum higginsianum]
MKSKNHLAAFSASALLASTAAAVEDFWLSPGSFASKAPPDFFDNRTAELYTESAAAPNATRSVRFQPFADSGGSNLELDQDEWTWRVNVSEFKLSHLASNFSALNITDPTFFTTTYDLSWPLGGNISTALRGSNSPFCVTTFDYLFPPNVTKMYTEENTNSVDCEHILGEDCLTKLYFEGNNLDGDQCVRPPWTEIPECSGTLGAAAQYRPESGRQPFTFTLATADMNLDSDNNSLSEAQPVLSGESIWTFESGVINGAEAAREFSYATNRLQVFMFNNWIDIRNGRASRPNILCMRVNVTTTPGNAATASASCRMTTVMAVVILTLFALLS